MAGLAKRVFLAGALATLAGCSSGGDVATGPPPGDHLVDLSWAANHERGVNAPGGGYTVEITGKPAIDLPYESGAFAPTSVTTTLYTGLYTVTVRAYAPDPADGSKLNVSAPSQLTVRVP